MAHDIAVVRDGHRTRLKWHRARQCAADPVFTGRRILEGMTRGASVEVDLVVHADRGYAVLHDGTLERETTGAGRVRETSAAVLRQLHLRDADGAPIDDKVMLLEDLTELLTRSDPHPDGLLQLDFKEDAAALDGAAIENFTAAVSPVAEQMNLSSSDAEAVAMLSAAVPRMRVGYDPCYGEVIDQLQADGDFAAFVAASVAASPRAEIVYLAYQVVLAAAAAGFPIVDAFHETGRQIDAYTIRQADAEGIGIAEELLGLKVDQITTDDPNGLGAALTR